MKSFWVSVLILPMVLSCTPLNKHNVDLVSNGYLKLSMHDRIGSAFGGFFGDPKWTTGTSSDGQDFVNLDGKMSYTGKDVDATVQFLVDKDGTSFSVASLAFNGVPQSEEMLNILLKKVYATAYPDEKKIIGDWGMFSFKEDGTAQAPIVFSMVNTKYTINSEKAIIVFDNAFFAPFTYTFVDDDHLIMTNTYNYKQFPLVRKATTASETPTAKGDSK